eukprot:RCo008737
MAEQEGGDGKRPLGMGPKGLQGRGLTSGHYYIAWLGARMNAIQVTALCAAPFVFCYFWYEWYTKTHMPRTQRMIEDIMSQSGGVHPEVLRRRAAEQSRAEYAYRIVQLRKMERELSDREKALAESQGK